MPKPQKRARAAAKAIRRQLKPQLVAPSFTVGHGVAGEVRRDQYLTPNQVADRLLVATVTVRLWASKGWLPAITTLGGHRRFRVQDVESFEAKRHQPGGKPYASGQRVLIIDDDPQFTRYLAGVISAHGAGVIVDVANHGFAAGIKCESIRPDIVILDLQMPEMDGFEVCTTLRGRFGKEKPRIVALTAFASPGNVERILAAGANTCIAKTTSAKRLMLEMGLARQM